jgi:hypothetical protein
MRGIEYQVVGLEVEGGEGRVLLRYFCLVGGRGEKKMRPRYGVAVTGQEAPPPPSSPLSSRRGAPRSLVGDPFLNTHDIIARTTPSLDFSTLSYRLYSAVPQRNLQ